MQMGMMSGTVFSKAARASVKLGQASHDAHEIRHAWHDAALDPV